MSSLVVLPLSHNIMSVGLSHIVVCSCILFILFAVYSILLSTDGHWVISRVAFIFCVGVT